MVKIKSKTWIVKCYKRKDLFSTPANLKWRWDLIEQLSTILSCFPETSICYDKRYVHINQRRINKNASKNIPRPLRNELLKEFATDLDKMCQFGFVHGDINRKNILYDGKKLVLVDLEPDLIQLKNGKRVFVSTMPYIAVSDLRNGRLTIATDKLAFACLCKIWGKGEQQPLAANKLVENRRKKDIPVLPDLPDSMLVDQTFSSIAELCS